MLGEDGTDQLVSHMVQRYSVNEVQCRNVSLSYQMHSLFIYVSHISRLKDS